MLHFFRRRRRHWRLRYTFLQQGQEVREIERFFTQAEAEERFSAMTRYHTRLRQPILSAQITGPKGFQKDLLETPLPV